MMSVLTLTSPAYLALFTGFGDSSVMPKVTEAAEVIKALHFFISVYHPDE